MTASDANLVGRYDQGLGVQPDVVEAHRWLTAVLPSRRRRDPCALSSTRWESSSRPHADRASPGARLAHVETLSTTTVAPIGWALA